MKIDKYLYELIDDYKSTNSVEEKSDIFNSLCSSIWTCGNKRRVVTKAMKYKVRSDLLNTEIGGIFDMWSEMEYKGYKSVTNETAWYSLIRQKINNLYTRYCDKEVILNKEYMNAIGTPKRLYYQWISGVEFDVNDITDMIDNAVDDSIKIKEKYQKRKMNLSWDDYKTIIELFLHKAIDNCKLIGEYEDKTRFVNMYDFVNEDNFYIKYFCKTLELYMRNYQKEYYGIKRGRNKKYSRCVICGSLIEKTGNKRMYCADCAIEKERKRKREIASKYRIAK